MSLKLWRVYCIQEMTYYEVQSVLEPTDCPVNPETDDIDPNATVIILDNINIDQSIDGNTSANVIGTVFGSFYGNLEGNTFVNGSLTIDDTTQSANCVTGALVIGGGVGVGLDLNVCGNTTLGNTTAETVTFNAQVDSDILPSTHETYDLGHSSQSWKYGYIDSTFTNSLECYDGQGKITVNDSLIPNPNDNRNLGSETNKWHKIFASNICAELTGNVTGDIISNNTSVFNGSIVFNGANITGLDGMITSDSVWVLLDKKASGWRGGSFHSGSWKTRTLNTIEVNPGTNDITLSSNQFTLVTGKYLISARAPAHGVCSHQIRLYNVTDSTVEQYGTSEVSSSGSYGGWGSDSDDEGGQSDSTLVYVLDVPSTKTYRIEHKAEHSQSRTGFGYPTGFGGSEIYTRVTIIKLTS